MKRSKAVKKVSYNESLKEFFGPSKLKWLIFFVMIAVEFLMLIFTSEFGMYVSIIKNPLTLIPFTLIIGPPVIMTSGLLVFVPQLNFASGLLVLAYSIVYFYIIACLFIWAVKKVGKKPQVSRRRARKRR